MQLGEHRLGGAAGRAHDEHEAVLVEVRAIGVGELGGQRGAGGRGGLLLAGRPRRIAAGRRLALADELRTAAEEQIKITRLRLGKLIGELA